MKIKVIESFRNLKAGFEYDFTYLDAIGYICIVGDNGCGKSTILHALRGYKNDMKSDSLYESDFKKLASNIEVEHDFEKIFYFDNVKDKGSDIMVGYDAINYLNSGGFYTKDKSHGESSLTYLDIFLTKIKPKIVENKTLIVLDEIDNGFSIKNMSRFINIIRHLTETLKCKVLVISHNPFFIQSSIIVYDISKRDYVTASSFIEEQTNFKLERIKTTDEN